MNSVGGVKIFTAETAECAEIFLLFLRAGGAGMRGVRAFTAETAECAEFFLFRGRVESRDWEMGISNLEFGISDWELRT